MSKQGGLSWAARLAIVALGGVFVAGVVGSVGVAGLWVRFQKKEENSEKSDVATDKTPDKIPVKLEGPALARIRDRKSLQVLMDTGTPPWTGNPPTYFLNNEGKPDGLDYQLALKIAATIGVADVKVLHSSYPELASNLKASTEADIVIMGVIPWAEPGISWSAPYLEFGLCLLVPAGSPIRTTEDLWGKKIGIYPDDAAERDVKRLIKGYTSMDRIEQGYFDLLLSGKLDAFVYDYPFTISELNIFYARFPQHLGKLKIAQYNLTDSTYSVAVREQEPDVLAAVNQTIQTWRASTDYELSLRSYILGGAGTKMLPLEPGAIADGTRTHTIQVGETLASIAATEYKNPDRWIDIWAANKNRIANPNLLEAGTLLVLPP